MKKIPNAQSSSFTLLLTLLFVGCSSNPNYKEVPDTPHQTTVPSQTPPSPSYSIPDFPSSSENSLYICDDIRDYVKKKVGSGECVDLLKACARTPNTYQWRPGQKVFGNKIPTGTAIATFHRGRYPNKSGYHAAIYISQSDKGIYVWDQWRKKPVHIRLIKNQKKGKPGNIASRYRVIKNTPR